MYRETAEAGQAWKGYTQEPGSGVSKLGHCSHAPGFLHADLSVQGALPFPFLAPGHHGIMCQLCSWLSLAYPLAM